MPENKKVAIKYRAALKKVALFIKFYWVKTFY